MGEFPMKKLFLSSAALCVLILCGCSDSKSVDKQLNQAVSLAKQNKWQEVADKAAELSKEYPQTVAPKLLQVLAYEKAGEMIKAVDLARQCVKMAPNDFTARYTLGRLYAADPNRQADAFTELEKAHSLNPKHNETLVLLCNLGIVRNEPNTGKYINTLQQNLYPAAGRILFFKGLHAAANGKITEAVNCIYSAAYKSQKDPLLILEAARFIDNLGTEPRKAKNLYSMFISIYSKESAPDQELLAEARKGCNSPRR